MASGIQFQIGADNRKFKRAVKDTNAFLNRQALRMKGDFKRLGADLGRAMKVGLAAGAAAAAVGIGKSIQLASDLNETVSKTRAIFGEASGGLETWAEAAAASLGQSKQQALDAAGTFGIFGKSAGKSGEDLAAFAMKLTGLASDFASFYNTSPDEAIVAIGAALRGESEPIRRFGVLLDAATLKARALKEGLIRNEKEALTPQIKVLASYAEIVAQAGDAAGDFQRTSDGLANQTRITQAEFKNLGAELGQTFLPLTVEAVKVFRQFVDVLKGSGAIEGIAEWVGLIPAAFREANAIVSDILAVTADIGNQLWNGVLRTKDLLESAFLTAVAIGRDLVADLAEGVMGVVLDLQTGLEFAFQRSIEFFDGKLRGIIDFLQTGVEWAIQQGLQGISKIPGLNKLLGLEGFQAQSFEEIARRNQESNPKQGFQAQSYQEIRDRNFANSSFMQAGMEAVQALREGSGEAFGQAAWAWDRSLNRPVEDVFGAAGFREDAEAFRRKAQEAVSPTGTSEAGADSPAQPPDPWARFRGFSTFTEPGGLTTGGLTTGGLTSGGLRQGEAARHSEAERERERDKGKTAEGTNERLDETNQILREALL